jgi:hypothetical protein
MHNCLTTRQARAVLALVVNQAPRLSGCCSVVYAPRCAPSRRGDDSLGSLASRSRIRRALEVGAEPEPGRCLSSGQLAQQLAGPIRQLDHHVIASA